MPCPWYNEEKNSVSSGIYCNRIDGRPGNKFWSCYCKVRYEDCPHNGGSDPFELVYQKKEEKGTDGTKYTQSGTSQAESYSYSPSRSRRGSSGTRRSYKQDDSVYRPTDRADRTSSGTAGPLIGVHGPFQLTLALVISLVVFMIPHVNNQFVPDIGQGFLTDFLDTGLISGSVFLAVWCTAKLRRDMGLITIPFYLTAIAIFILNIVNIPMIQYINLLLMVIYEIAGLVPNILLHIEDMIIAKTNVSDLIIVIAGWVTMLIGSVLSVFLLEEISIHKNLMMSKIKKPRRR